jgi:luciferase family oxidoreductase group 1
VEEFGLLDAFYPGRLDFGLGRSAGRPTPKPDPAVADAARPRPAKLTRSPARVLRDGLTENGLRIPARFSVEKLVKSPRFALTKSLLQQPNAETQDYGEQVDDILALLRGQYRSSEGLEAHAIPGEHADVEVWILGSSGGPSAAVAGANSLRFAANYHVSPATVLEAVDAYRAAFRPSAALDRPYVAVSADVVVGDDEDSARELAAGYGLWVRSIRSAEGAIPFPTPEEARAHEWTEADRRLVADRTETQFVGSPPQVADDLRRLRDATDADELIVTTITHDHADRVRSYELLAQEWLGGRLKENE